MCVEVCYEGAALYMFAKFITSLHGITKLCLLIL